MKIKDKFNREYKVGDFVSYPDMHYTCSIIGIVTKICEKRIKFKYFDNYGKKVIERLMNEPKQGIIINEIIPVDIRMKLQGEDFNG
jgi:hypothetical protein